MTKANASTDQPGRALQLGPRIGREFIQSKWAFPTATQAFASTRDGNRASSACNCLTSSLPVGSIKPIASEMAAAIGNMGNSLRTEEKRLESTRKVAHATIQEAGLNRGDRRAA